MIQDESDYVADTMAQMMAVSDAAMSSYMVNEIANIISKNQVKVPKRPGEPDRSMADISKIKKQLGWFPKISLQEGISMLLSNIDQWKDAPVWTPASIKEATKTWFKYLKK